MIFDKIINKTKDATSSPSETSDYYSEGVFQFNAGNYTQAMEFFQAELNKNPKNNDALEMLSKTYGKLGKTNLQGLILAKKKQSTSSVQTLSPSSNSNKPLGVKKREAPSSHFINFLNKIVNHSKEDYYWILRISLYCITVFNVIQLLSAATFVTKWGVWDWGFLFDIIGNTIGIIGIGLCILLPAYGLGALLYHIEENPKINHKKTNTALLIFNAIGIFVLYRMATGHLRMWSWSQLWLLVRPIVVLIGGVIAIGLIILILWILAKGLMFIGKKISVFFTS